MHPTIPQPRNGMASSTPDQVEQESTQFALAAIWRRVRFNLLTKPNWLLFTGSLYPPPPLSASAAVPPWHDDALESRPRTDLISALVGCRKWAQKCAYIMVPIRIIRGGL